MDFRYSAEVRSCVYASSASPQCEHFLLSVTISKITWALEYGIPSYYARMDSRLSIDKSIYQKSCCLGAILELRYKASLCLWAPNAKDSGLEIKRLHLTKKLRANLAEDLNLSADPIFHLTVYCYLRILCNHISADGSVIFVSDRAL